jgi:hypothetical protein
MIGDRVVSEGSAAARVCVNWGVCATQGGGAAGAIQFRELATPAPPQKLSYHKTVRGFARLLYGGVSLPSRG